MAFEKGIELEQLLRKRARQRHRSLLRESLGKKILYSCYNYVYLAEIVSLARDRQLKIRILGYTQVRGNSPPLVEALKLGSELLVEDFRIKDWQVLPEDHKIEPLTLTECAEKPIAHCDLVLSSSYSTDEISDLRWKKNWLLKRAQWQAWQKENS